MFDSKYYFYFIEEIKCKHSFYLSNFIFLQSCMLYPYVRALSTFGVEIKLVSIFWTITRFNRYINRMGLYQAKFLKIWFQVGAVVTILIFIPCISMSVFKLLELVGTLNIDAPSNSSSAVFDFQSSKVVLVVSSFLLKFGIGLIKKIC